VRVLIFDDHPDSLRLVFGRGANSPVELRPRASWLEFVLVTMLTMGAVMGMLWPLF
jgi:hypothetical protein